MKDPTLQCSQCDFSAGDKYGLKMHLVTISLPLDSSVISARIPTTPRVT